MYMCPYLTVPFSFSENSWNWIKKASNIILENYLKHNKASGLIELNQSTQSRLKSSSSWVELVNFLQSLKLNLNPKDIQIFYYSKTNFKDNRGNPHIDTTGPDSESGHKYDVPFRFNILLSGDETEEMFWWNKNRNHPDIVETEWTAPDKNIYKILRPRGKTLSEKYKILGKPDWSCNTLAKINSRSSFVKTDIVHSINWSGKSDRLVFSVRFFQSWDDIEKIRLKLVRPPGIEPGLIA